ncbi:MAG: glycosyltransferase [Betaproteobacteria bacterium]|nr:MAG: glycosyltransferase [Betaproteobacteria bacterium]
MRFLFVHQNFPGQYRHLAAHLARAGHEVVAIGETANLHRTPRLAGVKLYGYEAPPAAPNGFTAPVERAVNRGRRVAAGAAKLKQAGFKPDVIGAHIGWGEALFLKDVFPEAKLLLYCEFFYQPRGADMGFDPEFPATAEKLLRLRVMNSPLLMALDVADCGLAPTRWQHHQFPAVHKPRIAVIHDGIDTDVVAPAGERDPDLVTYVARNLEPYRGFHSFMRAIPEIQRRRPQARIVIVGGDEVSYSPRLPPGQTYRQRLLAELGDRIDLSRVEFRGKIPYAEYLALLRRSAVHVYLTYPFVLSWSLLEAMSAGCLVVASRTAPVEEVMRDGENGLLVDFFSPAGIAERVDYALSHQDELAPLRARARETVAERYDLRRICLPAQLRLVHSLVNRVRSTSPDKSPSRPRPTPPPVKEKAGSTAA